jgi:FkbM family methyltransferase
VAGSLGRESWVIRTLRPTYEAALHLAYRGRGAPWEINGEWYRIHPKYRRQLGQHYDSAVAEFISSRMRPGSVCLDVGANVGVYVLQLARWSGPSGSVIAFEPNPGARKILRQHVAWNALENQVSIEPQAVSSALGLRPMFAYEADGMSRLGEPNERIVARARKIEVPVTTLSDFCEANSVEPDWVVIDIEGFEIQALLGFERFLLKNRRKPQIVIEMHPNVWSSAETTAELAQKVIERIERVAIPLSGQNDIWSEHGHVYLQPVQT